MLRPSVRWSLVVASCGLFVPSAAFAQGAGAEESEGVAATARAQYNAGTKAFGEGHFVEAAQAFEAAADAKPSAVALYTAALSWEKGGSPDRAADDYTRALALPGMPADKLALAKERLAALEGSLGTLTLTGPDGTRVQLDANTARPVPATLHGTPGEHALSVTSATGTADKRTVTLERGKSVPLDVTSAPSPAPAPPPPPAPPVAPPPAESPAPADWKKPVGLTAIGVGGATLLAGVVLGLEAEDAGNAYKASPAQATYDHASSLQTWTNVAFIAGGVVTAAGIALFVWPAHKAAEPAPAALSVVPGGVSFRGTF